MRADLLSFLYDWNFRAININVEGISHEQSMLQPERGNCLNWVVGHILASRNSILELLGEMPVMAKSAAERYKRGSQPITDAADAVAFGDLLADLAKSQALLAAKLESLGDDALDSHPSPDDKKTLADSLAFLQFHEAYHTGQLGVLRRLAGKDGAIK